MISFELSFATTINLLLVIAGVVLGAILLMAAYVILARIRDRDKMNCRQDEQDRAHARVIGDIKTLHLAPKNGAKHSVPFNPTEMYCSVLGSQTNQDDHLSEILMESLARLLHTPKN